MIELALKSTLFFTVAAFVNTLMRRASAAQRHAVWMLAFAAVPAAWLLATLPVDTFAPDSIGAIEVTARTAAAAASIDFLAPLWYTVTTLLLLRLLLSFALLHYNRHRVSVPLTFGLFNPEILLPASATGWLPAIRASVLLHEEAHIARRDTIAQLFVQIVCAFLWFQPLAWYAARRAAAEREQACDDLVLRNGIDPAEYATHLVEIARDCHSVPAAAVAMSNTAPLETRLEAILNPAISRVAITRRFRLSLLLATATLASGVALLHAQEGKVHKIGDPGVTPPRVVHKVEPEYTQAARDAGITGSVLLSMEINTEGRAQKVEVLRSLDPGLDQNAVIAVSQWRFSPATKDDTPVIVAAKVEVNFRLQ
ncbi:MAG: M56 family metallopeptidase [Acidobacteria bacterium]|nr:M56 family metallopeptidase [Acidobacteriota bacterium]